MSDNGQAGHRDWFREALDRFEAPLTRYARKITGDADRARDVVQDTFLKLCTHGREQADGHLAEWLFTVCRNQALDVRRKESRMTLLAEEHAARTESRGPEPDRCAERQDAAGQILEILSELSENQQTAIRLKFQHGLSYREISARTGLTISNVGFLIHKGLQKIRERLRVQDDEKT